MVSWAGITPFFFAAGPNSRSLVTTPAQQFHVLVGSARRFVLTTHVNPDGDAIGSECALALWLRARGKEVAILNADDTPWNYTFLDAIHPVLRYDPATHRELIDRADVIVVLDINHLGRLGQMEEAVRRSHARKVCIDHHLDPDRFADIAILDDHAAATGQILYDLIRSADPDAVTQLIATSLYVAIMTDTGSFRFPKTDGSIHRIIADLLDRGADPSATYEEVYERGSIGRLQLLGRMLAGLQSACDGRVVYMSVSREMFCETGTNEADTDAFVPYTLTIRGVEVGLMFSELPDCIKVSFRSKGAIPINELAKRFGGNGHRNAAGARITGATLSEAISRVLAEVPQFLP